MRSVAAEAVDFEAKVLPILTERCAKCHGPDKQSAKLRLDSAKAIGEFGKKDLLVAGKPDESELLKRITLPADDKKRMPKGGDPLSAEQIALVREWITQGASLSAPRRQRKRMPAAARQGRASAAQARRRKIPSLPALPKASADAIAKIEAAGGTVMPLFADSPLLQVSFAQAASPPNDAAVATLAGAGDQIVWLNLKGRPGERRGARAAGETQESHPASSRELQRRRRRPRAARRAPSDSNTSTFTARP